MKQRGPGTGKLSRYQKVIRSPGFDALGRAARAVLKDLWTIVADNAPDDDGNYTTRASNEYIGQWSGYSSRSVTRALSELESAGFLDAVGDGPARTIALQTSPFTTRNLDKIDTEPRQNRQATSPKSTADLDKIDTPIRKTRPVIQDQLQDQGPEAHHNKPHGSASSCRKA